MDDDDKQIQSDLEKALDSGKGPKIARFALACLSGVPIAGGAIGGVSAAWSEAEQDRINRLMQRWLELQKEELERVGRILLDVFSRLDQNDAQIRERVGSKEYLGLVKRCFRDWSVAETEDKQNLIRNLLANAAATQITSDNVVRLFIDWIADYSDLHFKVIGAIYNIDGITRGGVWRKISQTQAREDSADADLFKLLFRDLSTGGVIRQHREVDYHGNFIAKTASKRPPGVSRDKRLTSAFDDEDQYELTALGKQFVHYALTEITPRLA